MNHPQHPLLLASLAPALPGARAKRVPYFALACLALVTFGCTKNVPPPSHIPQGAVLVPYEAYGARLFDDVIEPSALRLGGSSPSASRDFRMAERARASHVISRVRVRTVTSDLTDGVPTFHLVVAAVDSPLTRAALPEGSVELLVGPKDLAFGIVKSFDADLVGRSFIGFFRWFATPEEPRLHWHLSADTQDVAAAVRESLATEEPASR